MNEINSQLLFYFSKTSMKYIKKALLFHLILKSSKVPPLFELLKLNTNQKVWNIKLLTLIAVASFQGI